MFSVRVGEGQSLAAVKTDLPVAAADEALVEVRASSVNRGELALVAIRDVGWAPGQDVAGVVVAEAADGSGPRAGARVIGLAEQGAWSEFVAVRASRLAEVPDEVDLATAAALPMAGLTALRTVRRLGNLLGREVLVTGANGGVGRMQVRLAKLSGAVVTGLVREPAAGTLADVTVTTLADAGPFDAALDAIGGDVLKSVVGRLKPRADLVWFGSGSGQSSELSIYDFVGHEGASIHTYFSYAEDASRDADDLSLLLGLIAKQSITVEIASRWPLFDPAGAAQQLARGGTSGKIVLVREADGY
jgi:NADPH2:quinone reductase